MITRRIENHRSKFGGGRRGGWERFLVLRGEDGREINKYATLRVYRHFVQYAYSIEGTAKKLGMQPIFVEEVIRNYLAHPDQLEKDTK